MSPHGIGLRILVAILLVILVTVPAEARAIDDKEKAALATKVAEFDAAMRAQNYSVVIETIPPRVLAAIAGKLKVTSDVLRKTLLMQIDQVMKAVKIESFGMDLAKAEHKELASGAPYVLIPTRTVIDGGAAGRVTQSSFTLALIDDGKWYLLRVEDEPQVVMLRESYPDFSKVELPKGKMEIEKK
jgi:hypothetical protein